MLNTGIRGGVEDMETSDVAKRELKGYSSSMGCVYESKHISYLSRKNVRNVLKICITSDNRLQLYSITIYTMHKYIGKCILR